MDYKIIADLNKINTISWNQFFSVHPNGNFFQSPQYYEFCNSLKPQYEPFGLFTLDDRDQIAGFLIAVVQKEKGFIKSKLSNRCIIWGGPIVKDNKKEVTDILLKELIKTVQSKSIYIEFRNLFDLSKSKDVFERNGFKYKEHYNFVIGIGNVEDNFKKLGRTKKQHKKRIFKSS